MGTSTEITLFKQRIRERMPDVQLFTREIERLAMGTDAGFYRLVPQLVVRVNNEEEVVQVIVLSRELKIPLTFKAAGTSLSGQTISDSVLVEIGPDYNRLQISEDALEVTLEPGVRGGYANGQLAKKGKKIGPSPASINAAKIGGIVANNASGASYGIRTNSYNTLRGMRFVLYDGTVLDTRDKTSRQQFRYSHGFMLNQLTILREKIVRNKELYEKIQTKYQLKNTCGYGLNSLLDFDDPIDQLAHLMVGSEGTLGFISKVSLETIDDHVHKSCALLFFTNISEAAKAIQPLQKCVVSAAELMDRNALRAVENNAGMPEVIKSLPDEVAALLIETSAPTQAGLHQQQKEIEQALANLSILYPAQFTTNAKDYTSYWKVRKGLFTSAAATRPAGTTCIIEDVAFPGNCLPEALPALQNLMDEHGYKGAVMWGHLLDGNIHFLIMPDFSHSAEMMTYQSFMHELANMVVNTYNGSLKAEHGTGRNMAPFVAYEWGDDLYGIMKELKQILDPHNLLNPGVIINDDPEIYIKNIKPLPQTHSLVDACIECGFCESSCPSRDITLTPRQRIAVFRQLNKPEKELHLQYKKLLRDFQYSGEETCATDGLCALNCPVGINTGALIKELRIDKQSRLNHFMAAWVANHFGMVLAVLRFFLNLANGLKKGIPNWLFMMGSKGVHYLSGRIIPVWHTKMPLAAASISTQNRNTGKPRVIYFPACINRLMGNDPADREKESVVQVTLKVLQKAGYEGIIPEGVNELCCGMAFDSKGFKEQGWKKLKELENVLLEVSHEGKYPVLCDMSPCLLRMREHMDKRLELHDPVSFTRKYLEKKLHFKPLNKTVMVHTTCSNTKMGQEDDLVEVAHWCASRVIKPEQTGCCGWAGDKGFYVPELNASALRLLKSEVPSNASMGYSTSRTCEIGLSQHSGITYTSIFYLVDKATEPLVNADKAMITNNQKKQSMNRSIQLLIKS
jgi:D-lactate dehydrogenase